MVLADVSPLGITGREAEEALDRANIVVNRNAVPYDPRPPRVASGIRMGTPALTTRGMGTMELQRIAELIVRVLNRPADETVISEVRGEALSHRGALPCSRD